MMLSKRQVKDLMDAVNWNLANQDFYLTLEEVEACLDAACVSYKKGGA